MTDKEDTPPPSRAAPSPVPPRVQRMTIGALSAVFGIPLATLISVAVTAGEVLTRLDNLEAKAFDADRIRAERIQQLERLDKDIGVLRADVQALREARAEDSQQVKAMAEKLVKIDYLLWTICKGERGRPCGVQ